MNNTINRMAHLLINFNLLMESPASKWTSAWFGFEWRRETNSHISIQTMYSTMQAEISFNDLSFSDSGWHFILLPLHIRGAQITCLVIHQAHTLLFPIEAHNHNRGLMRVPCYGTLKVTSSYYKIWDKWIKIDILC